MGQVPTDKEVLDVYKQRCDSLSFENGVLQCTVKHLRGKAEFDMPEEMRGHFYNGQCPDVCDMVDGPCACGATHNVKEWLGKLNKQLAVEQEKSRWMPVEDPPETGQVVLIVWKDIKIKPCIVIVNDTWPDSDSYTHWRSTTLPEG